MNFRNPRYNHLGTIDVEIEHPMFGWVPFTASPNDADPQSPGPALYAAALAAGNVAPYEEPPVAITYANLTARQFRLGLLQLGITPAMIDAALDAFPEQQREAAKIEWEYANSFKRSHPLVVTLSATFGKTEEEINMAWKTAETL